MNEIQYYNKAFKMISDAIFPEAKIDPCEDCEIKHTSDCCGAPVIMHNICSDCGHPCDDVCDKCDFGDNLAIREGLKEKRDTVKLLDELHDVQDKYK